MYEKITELLEKKAYPQLKEILSDMNEADIAAVLKELPQEKLPLVYRILPKELAAEVFVNMDSDDQEFLIRAFSDNELREVLDEMYVDDAVDVIEEMPATVVKRILQHTDPEMRKSINEILQYPEDSAGSLMTTEYVDLKKYMTVADAFTRIRRTGVDKETIYICYVTDENRKLLGIVTVKDLLLSDSTDKIFEIMDTNIISTSTLEDKEVVAEKFRKYDLLALPVVDRENRLVGIITIDDAMDVLQDENTEDIEKMAAILPGDKPYLKTPVFEIFKHRIPWLLLLMVSATFTGIIITRFEHALAAYVALALGVPPTGDFAQAIMLGLVTDTGGFLHGNTSADVLKLTALLVENGCDLFRALCDMQAAVRLAMVDAFKSGSAEFGGKKLTGEQLMRMLDVLQGAERGIKNGLSEKANFEVALLKAVEQSRARAINTLIRELDKLSAAPAETQKKNS